MSKKTVAIDGIVQFIDEENIVTYVDIGCAITVHPEAPIKVGQATGERKNIFRSCEKPKCIPSNDQHNCSFDEEHTSNNFLNQNNLWEIDPAALKSLNHWNDWDSVSNQYPQTTTHRPRTDFIRFSLHCNRWTVKGRDCASALHSFIYIFYRTGGRVKETVATVKEWSDPWKT